MFSISWLSSACNHLFYYPDNLLYYNPKAAELNYKEAFLPTVDGEQIFYWDFAAVGEEKGTILQFHGNAQNMSSHVLFVLWLRQEGYRVVTFDYRGYGRSTGKPSRMGLVIDGETILNHVCSDLNSPLIIIGQSLGGAVAVPVLAKRNDSCVSLLILDSTFASYRSIVRKKLGSNIITWPLQFPLPFLVSDDASPIDYINQIETPLIVVHSQKDPVVPFDEGKRLFDHYQGKNKTFWKIAIPAHTAAFSEDSPTRHLLVEKLRKVTTESEVTEN